MDTFASRSIARQYRQENSSILQPAEVKRSHIPEEQNKAIHTGYFGLHQVELLPESSKQASSFSLISALPGSAREVSLKEYQINEVTPQQEQGVVGKKEDQSQIIASAISSFTDLDQLRREQSRNYVLEALNKFYDYCDFYFNAPLDMPEEKRAEPLNQEFGFTGLSNHLGTCYLNAALQFSAEVVRTIERKGSPEEKQILDQNLERLPHFRNFINGSLKTNADQRNLYREISCEVSKSFWFRDGAPSMNQLQTGFKRAGHAPHYIEHLLTRLQVSPLRFEEKTDATEECYEVRTLLDGRLDEFSKLQSSVSSAKLVGKIPVCFVRKCIFEKKEEEPLQEVQFLHQDDRGEITPITFVPKVVATRNPRHVFCCIQKEGRWYEINDSLIKKIPEAWEEKLSHFMGESGAMVLYERQMDSTQKTKKSADEESFETKPEEAVVDEEKAIEPAPNSITKGYRDFVEMMSAQSFYYYQRYQQLLQLEGKEPTLAPKTLRERVQSKLSYEKELKQERSKYNRSF